MDFFISPSSILLSLFGISTTYASPLDLAGFMINNTQVTGPRYVANEVSTDIWIAILFVSGPLMLLAGYGICTRWGHLSGRVVPSLIGCGLLCATVGKFMETKYWWTQKLRVYLPFRLGYICQYPCCQFTFICHQRYSSGVFYNRLLPRHLAHRLQWPPRRALLDIHRRSGIWHTTHDRKIEFVDL